MPDPDATRRAIIAAARVEFSERGLGGAHMRPIAARAGVSTERVYAYFDNKGGLFVATVEEAAAELAAACADHDSAAAWHAASIGHVEAARLVARGEFDGPNPVVRQLAGDDPERAARIGLALAWVVFPGLRDTETYRQALGLSGSLPGKIS